MLSCLNGSAQPSVYFSHSTFNLPGGQPFLETYLTFVGSALKPLQKNGTRECSANVTIRIYKDSALVKAERYNIHGPAYTDSLKAPTFIDSQRYPLPNGNYTVKMDIYDNNDGHKKTLTIVETLSISFSDKQLESSSFQILESYEKAMTKGPLTKSGYNLVPYTVNYYPESSNDLAFYIELYNADKGLGENAPFVINYFLETADGKTRLNNYGAFKKEKAAPVNPVLARLNIARLGTGDYNLVLEVKDANNKLMLTRKYFFQRLNQSVDIVALQKQSEQEDISQYVGRCQNTDTLKMFVECLWPIADGIDKERVVNTSLNKDPELMRRFVVDFWKRRAADTTNPLKLWAQYYKQVQIAMALFKCGKQPGYYTDRGRVFLQYGAPSLRSQQVMEVNTFPYEIWQYYRTTDASTGMFFSNRKFVFVNKTLGDDCYNLVHSDMRGEIYNPRWQFEVTRRNNNGISDPDNNTPRGTELNQFNEIYNSPR